MRLHMIQSTISSFLKLGILHLWSVPCSLDLPFLALTRCTCGQRILRTYKRIVRGEGIIDSKSALEKELCLSDSTTTIETDTKTSRKSFKASQ